MPRACLEQTLLAFVGVCAHVIPIPSESQASGAQTYLKCGKSSTLERIPVDWVTGSAITPSAETSLMPQVALGFFEVKTAPLPPDEATAATSISRYSLDKAYRGDLEGASAGEMLGAGNPGNGTAGYVAIEQVTGTLHGKRGSFALQHFGSMHGGQFNINVRVVPGSGTEDLEGIAGALTITISGSNHSYTLEYTLPGE